MDMLLIWSKQQDLITIHRDTAPSFQYNLFLIGKQVRPRSGWGVKRQARAFHTSQPSQLQEQ
jgi:hypothetical protein